MLNQNEERLQKALARAGIASRRACEQLIAAGRVKVNGKIVTELGTKIDPARDRVSVDDEPVPVRPSAAPQKIYLVLNKPTGYLSTVSDPQGRPTVLDLIEDGKYGRLYPVGRLDADSEGLLLLTNDGAFANALSHPRYGVEKEYIALLDGIIAMKDIETLRQGVPIRVEDPETGDRVVHQAHAVRVDLIRHEGSNSVVRFVLKEGKKRQIRLMAEAVDHFVIELKRVRFGLLKLADLPSGKYRALSKTEVHALIESARQKSEPSVDAEIRKAGPKPLPVLDNRRAGPKAPHIPDNRRGASKPLPAAENRRTGPKPPPSTGPTPARRARHVSPGQPQESRPAEQRFSRGGPIKRGIKK